MIGGVHGGLDNDDQTRAICINLYTYVCALTPYCTQSSVAFLMNAHLVLFLALLTCCKKANR